MNTRPASRRDTGDGNAPPDQGLWRAPFAVRGLLAASTNDHHAAHRVALFEALSASVTNRE